MARRVVRKTEETTVEETTDPRGSVPEPPASSTTDLSAKLKTAMNDAEEAEQKDRQQSARSIVFESANKPREVAMPKEVDAIVNEVFLPTEDLMTTYKELEGALRLGDKLAERAFRNKALDGVESKWRKAHQLYISAKYAVDNWERENAILFATLRNEATKLLQHEKDQGRRNKTITDADVTHKMAELFPDEMRAQESKRKKYELMVENMKNLTEAFASRCKSLNRLVGGE